MQNILKAFLTAFLIFNLAGCSTAQKVLPAHDEVLIYQLPFDLTYLRTLEVLNAQEGWQLETTNKENGLICIRNTQYSRLDDADKRVLTFVLKRVDNAHTSVALAPESQRALSGGDMLKVVGKKLSGELR